MNNLFSIGLSVSFLITGYSYSFSFAPYHHLPYLEGLETGEVIRFAFGGSRSTSDDWSSGSSLALYFWLAKERVATYV